MNCIRLEHNTQTCSSAAAPDNCRNILNKQLLQLLQQAGISNPDAAADMQEVLHLHQHLAAEAQTERLQIMAQVTLLPHHVMQVHMHNNTSCSSCPVDQ